MNTRLTYEYRDGGCNRFFTDVVLAGEMTDRRWTRIRGICNDGDQFIAHQVGLREVFSFCLATTSCRLSVARPVTPITRALTTAGTTSPPPTPGNSRVSHPG